MSDDFSLRALVRSVLDTTRTPDLGEISATVMDQIAPEDYGKALAQTMRQFVRQIVSEQRMSLQISTPSLPTAPRSRRESPHVAEIRAWRSQLRQIVHVGSGSKFLGDCTRDDLIFAAEERRELAARNNAKARQLEIFVALLNEHGAKTVGELPDTVLRGALEAAA
jgi:hypothetical protein